MSNEHKQVRVHYRGTLDSGAEFDSSYTRGEPLAFECMAGQMIPGFDAAVKDMQVGEKKTVRLDPENSYGPYREDLIQTIPLSNLPGSESLEKGQKIMLNSPFGQVIPAQVKEKTDKEIVLDLNHELAGQALTFEIELISVG